MTTRDRTVLMVLGVFAMVAAFWFLLLSPKREEVATLKDGVAAAQLRLQTANTTATSAATAMRSYVADYRAVADLGKAVPADDDVASLVFQLQTASKASGISFDSIKLTGSAVAAPAVATPAPQAGAPAAPTPPGTATGTTAATTSVAPAAGAVPTAAGAAGTATTPSPVPAAQSSFAGLPPGASVGAAGLPTMPFDFEFSGPFARLEQLLRKIDAFTKTGHNRIRVNGRLMSIDSIALSGFPQMKATIHATAFLLPTDQGLLNGATAAGPGTTTVAANAAPATTGAVPAAGGSVPVTPVATATGVGR